MTFAVTLARDHVCQEKAAMSSGNILCFESHRAQKTGQKAQNPNARAALESPFLRYDHMPGRALDARQLAHRRRMLEHGYRKSNVKGSKVGHKQRFYDPLV
jgi:hypothetical protein